jgi:hypothetical protein
VLYNKNCVQDVAQTLMSNNDTDILGRAHVALDEANEATNISCNWLNRLQKKSESMPTGSEASSITGGRPHKQKTDKRERAPPSWKLGRLEVARTPACKEGHLSAGQGLPPSVATALGGPGGSDFLFRMRKEEAGDDQEEYLGLK